MSEIRNTRGATRGRYRPVPGDPEQGGQDSSRVARLSDVPPPPPVDPLFYKLKATLQFIAAVYYLHYMEVYHAILRGAKVNHTAFQIGLAVTVAAFFIKSYVELYEGKLKKKKIDYSNYRQTTHAIIVLILIAGIAYHIALWNQFGAIKTIIIVSIAWGYGVLLQFCIVCPVYVQNIVGFVFFTLALQQYK